MSNNRINTQKDIELSAEVKSILRSDDNNKYIHISPNDETYPNRHTHIVSGSVYDPLLPLSNWTPPTNTIKGNTVSVKFSDGIVANYTYDGSVWVFDFIIDYVLTLSNYSELRLLDNYYHDIVNVEDWTYTGPDGNTYTTLGGVFKRVSSGMENGGTIIVSANGDIWERDWDKIHVQPEWWECGGYDYLGNNYISKYTSKNGVYNDNDRIINALFIVKQGGSLELYKEKEYIIDITIQNTF